MTRFQSLAEKSDEALALAAQSNDMAAFEELVGRYQTRLLHFLCQRNDRETAEDILQETFLAAHRGLHSYRPPYRFSTWLFTIAKRRGAQHRAAAAPFADGLEDDVSSCLVDPAEALCNAEEKTRLWTTARRLLSERQFQALWLFYIEEMSCTEVGQVLEASAATIKMMLSRARKQLADQLAEPQPVTPQRAWRKAG